MIDVSINFEKLIALLPGDIQEDPIAVGKWVNNTITGIKSTIEALGSDEVFIHADAIAVGPIDAEQPFHCDKCGEPPTEGSKFKCEHCGSLWVKVRIIK